jgi:hypothetical protein
MKRCPTCQKTYPDDAPAFCANDGTPLVAEGAQPYAAPPAPQPYQAQPAPSGIKPPTQWQQPSPPQQGQWGGQYQQPAQQHPGYAQQYAQPSTGRNPLALASFIVGIISFLALAMIFLMSQRIVPPDRTVAEICFWGSAIAGLIAIVLGLTAIFSKRLRSSKWMAILGLVLGIPAILFFAYVMIAYSTF